MSRSDLAWTLGLDLGGTGIRAVAADRDGRLLGRATVPTPPRLDEDAVIGLIRGLLDHLGQRTMPVAIGIGASGPIDAAGLIQNPDTLPAFTGLDLPALLSERFQARTRIDNDAVTAALAEGAFGAAVGYRNYLHVTLGTGVGVCAVVDGRPMRGADGAHPEAGHLGVASSTTSCYCGRARCWEQGASRRALQRAAAAVHGLDPDDPSAIGTARTAALLGDPSSAAVFASWARVVADGLASLTNLLRPPLVVLGGSAALAFDTYRDSLEAELERLAVGPVPQIRATQLDDFGGAVGATLLVTGELDGVGAAR